MPHIYLLRHCDYDNPRNILPGRLPVELSKKGLQQAENLKEYFADKNITKIYSSAVMRAKQTAELVADGKIEVIFDKRLLETFSSYQGYWGENWDGKAYNFFNHREELGGENVADIYSRMANFWDETSKALTQNIVICSHGDPLQTLFTHIHNLPMMKDDAKEGEVPGWLEKGEFMDIVFEKGQRISTSKPQDANHLAS